MYAYCKHSVLQLKPIDSKRSKMRDIIFMNLFLFQDASK